mgnify:CR=1 FL=1
MLTGKLRNLYRDAAQPPVVVDTSSHTHASDGLLSAPRADSALSSPTFSIGSDEEEDHQISRAKGASDEQRALREEAPQGLRLDTGVGLIEDRMSTSPVEEKAKGFLSEEGELFRKSKALSLDEEDEQEHYLTAQDGGDGSSEPQDQTTEQSAAQAQNPSVDTRPSISGAELRAELLEVEVPKTRSRPSSSDDASPAGEEQSSEHDL